MEYPKLQEVLAKLAQIRDRIQNAQKHEEHTHDVDAFPHINLERITQDSEIFEYYKELGSQLLEDLLSYLNTPKKDPITDKDLLTEKDINEIENMLKSEGIFLQPAFLDFEGWTDSLNDFKQADRIDRNPLIQNKIIEPFFRFDIINFKALNAMIGKEWRKEDWRALHDIFTYSIDGVPGDSNVMNAKYAAFLQSKGLDQDSNFRLALYDAMLTLNEQMKLVASELTASYGGDTFINIIAAYFARYMYADMLLM